MGLFSKGVIRNDLLTPHQRSEKVTNTFLNALNEYREINQDIELEQTQIKSEIEERQTRHDELEVLKTKNSKFADKLSQFFGVED